MQKKVRIAIVILFLALSTSSAFASDTFSSEKYNMTEEEALESAQWIQTPGGWKYKRYDGTYQTGYFYDKNGDFYYANKDGIILINSKDAWNQEYNVDGRLLNPGYINAETSKRYDELAKKYEFGSNVEFNDQNDIYSFMEYYGKNYKLGSQLTKFKVFSKTVINKESQTRTVYFINNAMNEYYDRNKVVNELNKTFPRKLNGNNNIEKLKDACEYVKNTIKYDDNFVTASIEDGLANKKGGCWHFVKLVKFLLDREGINNEAVAGLSYGFPHIWLRFNDVDGKWIYSDPTFYANGLSEYLNIDYKIYKDNYRTNRLFERTIKGPHEQEQGNETRIYN